MSYQVRLLRRMGQNPAGSVRLYSDTEAAWLVNGGYGVYVGSGDTEQPAPVAAPAETEQQGDDQRPAAPNLAELKAEAEKLGLPTYGTKAQLADRIDQRKAELDAEQDQDDEDDLDDDLDEDDDA